MSGPGTVLKLRIVPNAAKHEVVGLHGDAVKIKLQAPPVDGKANAALIAFLAERLGIPRNQITIKAGETGRNKLVAIASLDSSEIMRRLGLA